VSSPQDLHIEIQTEDVTAGLKPFVKWIGGKRQIKAHINRLLPQSYTTYLEPFLGGGAVFFELKPHTAIISDINEELINTYEIIRLCPLDLISAINEIKNEETTFYRLRDVPPSSLNYVKRAARFLYLNRACHGGVYRQNSDGEFNTPYGNYKNLNFDEDNILEVSKYLQENNIRIYCQDFERTLSEARTGDFIFIDSPYVPLNSTSFTKYHRKDFSIRDHERVALSFRSLDSIGCSVMLTNADTPWVRKLYQGYQIQAVTTNRTINSKGNARKNSASEVIITNYEVPEEPKKHEDLPVTSA
jgi:DNA adenine methylase